MNCPFCDPKVRLENSFYENSRSLCLANIKPVVPGHVLIIPKRHVESFDEIEESEVVDIFLSLRKVYQILKKTYGSKSFNVVIQDGIDAGQSINHLHIHVCPRIKNDINNKELYNNLLVDPDNRKPLNQKEMKGFVEKLKTNS